MSGILEEAGIKCRIVGEHLAPTLGIPATWDMARISILVSDADQPAARKLIDGWAAVQFPQNRAKTKRKVQYGLKWLLINFTLVAMVFALYPLLESNWHLVAEPAFAFIVLGNLMMGVYLHKQRERSS